MNTKLLGFSLSTPLALAGVIAAMGLPAQAQITGTATFNGRVNFFNSSPPSSGGLSAPPEFWFPKDLICISGNAANNVDDTPAFLGAPGVVCDFNVSTATGDKAFLLNSPADAQLQYLLTSRPDLTTQVGFGAAPPNPLNTAPGFAITGSPATDPSLILDKNAGKNAAVIAPNNFIPDLIASGIAAPDQLDPTQFLAQTLIANPALPSFVAGKGIPWLQLAALPTDPLQIVYLQEINKFNFSSSGSSGSTVVFASKIYSERYPCGNTLGCSATPDGGDGSFNATFTLTNTQSALNISVNDVPIKEAPEPSNILGLAAVSGVAFSFLRKKKENK